MVNPLYFFCHDDCGEVPHDDRKIHYEALRALYDLSPPTDLDQHHRRKNLFVCPLIARLITMTEVLLQLNRQGMPRYDKLSYPARFGRYHELIWEDCTYHLALDGFPKFLQGRAGWPHPQEWLKLSRAGDWAYYSAMGYRDLFGLTGEYYYPHLNYVSNPIYSNNPLQSAVVQELLADHDGRCALVNSLAANKDFPADQRQVLKAFSTWTTNRINGLAAELHRIIKARVPVLPPDCRHVDYDVLPLMISEGCLANCGFCRIKTSTGFRLRDRGELSAQLEGLQNCYGPEIANLAGLFLGQHDALGSGIQPVLSAVEPAMGLLRPSPYVGPFSVFLFSSASSLMAVSDQDLQRLNDLPGKVYMNVGLESFDQQTLDNIAKPVSAEENRKTFKRICQLNRRLSRLNISINIIAGNLAGPKHLPATEAILAELSGFDPFTTMYLSPLMDNFNRAAFLADLRNLKSIGKLEVFPYLIQRL